MIIKVEKHTEGYVVLDTTAVNDERLTWAAKGLHSYLVSKPSNWEVRVSDLVARSPTGEQVAQTALQNLRENGYANLVPFFNNGKLAGKKWVIYERPLVLENMSDSRQAGKRPVGDVHDKPLSRPSVKPTVGKAAQLISIDSEINIDSILNNENGGGGENFPKIEKSVAVEFAQSSLALNGISEFKNALLGRGAPADFDPAYYYNRLTNWGMKTGIKPCLPENQWIEMAIKFIAGDAKRPGGYKKAIQHATNFTDGSPNGSPNGRSGATTDKKRAAAESAVRIAENVLARRAERSSFLSRINDQR